MSEQSTPARQREQVEYRPIDGYPGYRVGDDGSVWSCRIQRRDCDGLFGPWRRKKASIAPKGHLYLNLRVDGKSVRKWVHHLVLEAFVVPQPKGMQCRHFPDRDPSNNRLDNLSWGTHEENQADKKVHGTQPQGETSHLHKLTAAQVTEIRRRKRNGDRACDLAKEYGVSCWTVYDIMSGRSWTHLG